MQDLYEILARQLRAQGRLRRVLLFVAGVSALVGALLPLAWGDPAEVPAWSSWLHPALIFLAGVIPLLFVFFETTPEELVRELGRSKEAAAAADAARNDAESEKDAVIGAYRRSVVLYEVSKAIGEASDAVLLAPADQRRDIADAQILSILDRLIERKGELFGMNDDRWTFGLYVPEGGRLEMRLTRRWSRESEKASHRSWKRGKGHVGQAFETRRELVCSDSTDPNVSGFLIASGENARDYDSELYLSFASLPIMIGTRPDPLGVLVATSDQRGRFSPPGGSTDGEATPDTVEPLRVAANVIATILCLTESTAGQPK